MHGIGGLIAAALLLGLGKACLPVVCEQLDKYNCAADNETVITINIFGCSGKSCSLSTYLSWIDSDVNGLLYCSPANVPLPNANATICPVRPIGETLVNGDIYPIRCESKEDCRLENGNTTECVCGLDGFQYCQPLLGAEIFDSFWKACDSDTERTVDGEVWSYYTTLQQLYVYYISAPDCAKNLLSELVYLQSYSYSSWVFLSTLVLFLSL